MRFSRSLLLAGSAVLVFCFRTVWLRGDPPKSGGQALPQRTKFVHPEQGAILPSFWLPVARGYESLGGLAVNTDGDLFFNDTPSGKTYVIPAKASADEPEKFLEESGHAKGQAFGPDGRLYALAAGEKKIVAYRGADTMEVIADHLSGLDLAVCKNGNLFFTQSDEQGTGAGTLWLLDSGNAPRAVDTHLGFCSGIALGSDQTTLYVADSVARAVYGYRIQSDGLPVERREFFSMPWPAGTSHKRMCGIHVAPGGLLFIAGPAGIHVCDETGREISLLTIPDRQATHVALAGPTFEDLYAACGDTLYTRKIRMQRPLEERLPSNKGENRKTSVR